VISTSGPIDRWIPLSAIHPPILLIDDVICIDVRRIIYPNQLSNAFLYTAHHHFIFYKYNMTWDLCRTRNPDRQTATHCVFKLCPFKNIHTRNTRYQLVPNIYMIDTSAKIYCRLSQAPSQNYCNPYFYQLLCFFCM
jgi:hypothetical protein